MFALYEAGQRLSRPFGPMSAAFFTETRQRPRTPGNGVYVIYVGM